MPYRLSASWPSGLDEIWCYIAEHTSPPTADDSIDVIVDRFDCCRQPRMVASGRSSAMAFDSSPSRLRHLLPSLSATSW